MRVHKTSSWKYLHVLGCSSRIFKCIKLFDLYFYDVGIIMLYTWWMKNEVSGTVAQCLPTVSKTGFKLQSHNYPLLLLLSLFSRVWPCATPQTAALQAPPSLGFSRQEHWSGLPFPPPGHLANPGIEPASPVARALQADSLPLSHGGSPTHYWFMYKMDN